jgi:pimaricinolide synthase PimS1
VLRAGRAEAHTLCASLGAMWVRGVGVEWGAVFEGSVARRVELPAYAFQRARYWLESSTGAGDVAAVGQAPAGHPLLGAAVAMADGEGWLFTGRLSLGTHAWLADHAVLGRVVLAGTAFVELALHAGGHVGCEAVRELVLEAPLVLSASPPESDAVQIQVAVAEPDESGCRAVGIYSRLESAGAGGDPAGAPWTRHASGVLAPGELDIDAAAAGEAAELGGEAWPPAGAVAVEIDGLYERLGELGLEYGPLFQGLRAMWRAGEELFAEVALGEEFQDEAARFALHPALLDAALHTVAASGDPDGVQAPDGLRLPFSWSGVSLSAAGASRLRARLSPAGEDAVSVLLADGDGRPVAAVRSLSARPVSAEQLNDASRSGRAQDESLFQIEWAPVALGPGVALAGEEWTVVDCAPNGSDVPAQSAQLTARRTLALVQEWLADERRADSRLVLLTRAALAAAPDEVPDIAQAAVWGLIRSAQSEHPGRFVLVDLDGEEDSREALAAALAVDEPQLAIRAGRAYAPRLTPATAPSKSAEEPGAAEPGAPWFDSERTVLITGGTGMLGGLVARHVVSAHGVRSVVLASRRGAEAAGAEELERELADMGAEVRIAQCDVADRAQLQALLASVPARYPLGAVVHMAGVLDDGVIETLTPEALDRVLAPKVDAALHLHELTEQLDLSSFVLFSSAAASFGAAGQGNYAAANMCLEALAARRRAQGLSGVALAWGPWAQAGGMTDQLSEADRARMTRGGVGELSRERGLELFDAAQGVDRATVIPLRLDTAALRSQARVGVLPALLRGLVRAPARRVPREGAGALLERLRGVPQEQRAGVVLDSVRREVAVVLGHSSQTAIDPERVFKELGFDSLSAVELRNRLAFESGLRLPATLIFNYPNASALADYILSELPHGGTAGADAVGAELDRLESMLTSVDAEDAERVGIAERLRSLLSGLGECSVAIDEETDAVEDELDAAGDEEMFELIDRELFDGVRPGLQEESVDGV